MSIQLCQRASAHFWQLNLPRMPNWTMWVEQRTQLMRMGVIWIKARLSRYRYTSIEGISPTKQQPFPWWDMDEDGCSASQSFWAQNVRRSWHSQPSLYMMPKSYLRALVCKWSHSIKYILTVQLTHSECLAAKTDSIWKSHCKKKTSSCRCHKGNPNCVTFEFFPSVPWPYRNRFFRQSKTSTRTSRGVATDHEKEKTWISLISRNFLWKEILKQLKIFEKTHLNEFPASQMSQRMRKRKKERKKEKERLWKSVFKKKQGESFRF